MSPTRLARISLVLAGIGVLGFGVPLLVRPSLLGIVGIELTRPAAATEIRSFYGGLEIGLAVFFFAAARRDAWLRPALFAQAAGFGGIVAGRLVGFLADGSAEPMLFAFIALEASGALLGAVALWRLTRGGAGS
ncbi:MAG TPA: DUF4345 family protein [Longimicrobium sp.]|nr:DUF4345 family protein [Longimicrobium sp.]